MELKRCPFCNRNAEIVTRKISDGQVSYKIARIECVKCHCRTRDYIIDGYYGATTTEENAIEAWNRRVSET